MLFQIIAESEDMSKYYKLNFIDATEKTSRLWIEEYERTGTEPDKLIKTLVDCLKVNKDDLKRLAKAI